VLHTAAYFTEIEQNSVGQGMFGVCMIVPAG